MWKSLLIPFLGVLLVPAVLHGQCKQQQGAQAHAGHGMQMGGQQMGGQQMGGQQGTMMQRNLVRELIEDADALRLTPAEVARLEPLAQQIDGMNGMFEGIHRSGAGRTLTPTGRDSLRTTHMDVRRTRQAEVLHEVKTVLGAERYEKALELLLVRPHRMN